MAASEFRVVSPHGDIDWSTIESNLRLALSGRLALESRLADRAASARPKRAQSAVAPAEPTVKFDDSASSNATFLEVRAPDTIGVLHRITKAIADLGLDIRHARVLTLGNEVVDSFYVRESGGGRITDEEHKKEISRAILFSLSDR
jgi:[protein-PII] uridylyltransferase